MPAVLKVRINILGTAGLRIDTASVSKHSICSLVRGVSPEVGSPHATCGIITGKSELALLVSAFAYECSTLSASPKYWPINGACALC